MVTVDEDVEGRARGVEAAIRYLGPGDYVTRRYVAQGKEINTGDYFDYPMTVRDGWPIREHFQLDTHGFVCAPAPTAIADFHDRAEVDARYLDECSEHIRRLTGASRVVAQGWMIRTSADLSARAREKVAGYRHAGGIQPPAGEAHVDYNTPTAHRAAARTYAEQFAGGPGFTRFLACSFWRAFSLPPQDVPLAVCDGRSVGEDNEASNTLFVVDEFPTGDALTAPVAGEEEMIAATIFRHSPDHRWWYFSGMERDDALLFKFFDSDHARTWRCPHTAFRDPSFAHPGVRESIEVRAMVFWE